MHSGAEPTDTVIADTLHSVRSGALPATVGLVGAGVGLAAAATGLGPATVMCAASLPASALGLARGLRQGNAIAAALGSAGIVALALAWALASP